MVVESTASESVAGASSVAPPPQAAKKATTAIDIRTFFMMKFVNGLLMASKERKKTIPTKGLN
jgi:hypothetical protein